MLVLDRDALTFADRRVVAELGDDEPAQNAAIVCEHYLRDERRGRCRPLTATDLTVGPGAGEDGPHASERRLPRWGEIVNTSSLDGEEVFRLESIPTGSAFALRWRAHRRGASSRDAGVVCLRAVIGALESYEPACAVTRGALDARFDDAILSRRALRAELERVQTSPIVLNRKLRDAVRLAVERDGMSMSEIAMRCGRIKRESRGVRSGETSWLARRVGLLPESGSARPTPWIHSNVLALIARDGLGISPREVELG